MTRQEFLEELQLALQGLLSQAAVRDNIRYYDHYIREEMQKGKTEQAVIEALGNPRLIAKTLIDTTDQYHRAAGSSYYSEYNNREGAGTGYHSGTSENSGWYGGGGKQSSWFRKLLMIVIAIIMIVFVANLVAFLLPILVPVILILLICSLVFGSRR